jgi:hypothetical protein
MGIFTFANSASIEKHAKSTLGQQHYLELCVVFGAD